MQIISRDEATSADLTHYFTGAPCKHGHLSQRYTKTTICCECMRLRVAAYKVKNPDKVKETNRQSHVVNRPARLVKAKAYRDANVESVAAIKKDWYERNRETISEARKAARVPKPPSLRAVARGNGEMYYMTNKPCKHGHWGYRFTKTGICIECNRINAEKIRNEGDGSYMREFRERYKPVLVERRATDIEYRALLQMREMVRRVIRGAKGKKNKPTVELLGYTPTEFMDHISAQFTAGMSWLNHGEWHVDHIVPVIVMLRRGETCPKVVNALSNLQPLWAIDNMKKAAKCDA